MKKRRLILLGLAAASVSLIASCIKPGLPPPVTGAPYASGIAAESPVISSSAPAPSEEPPEVPAEWRDGGIFSGSYDKAYALLETMSLEEKLGQMLLARCPHEDAGDFIRRFQPGGLVLFDADFKGKTADGVAEMISAFQGAAKIPLIISTDEEGGTVVRVSRNPKLAGHRFQSPQQLYKSGGFDAVREDALSKAALFESLGLNLNLAPVADVAVGTGGFMYRRAFGLPAEETGEYAATVVSAMRETAVSSALKHFPGYGNNADTHTGPAVDSRPYGAFTESDFIPFRRGIDAGAECVMVCHNIVECMDAGVPASLSEPVHRILRETLDFTGIIMTDDLSMGAVSNYKGHAEPAVLAVLAGNDMLIVTDCGSARDAVLAAAVSGEIPAGLIDHAVFRILSWKLDRGII